MENNSSSIHAVLVKAQSFYNIQKEPTDIFDKIEFSFGSGQGWWYVPNKLTNIQLP